MQPQIKEWNGQLVANEDTRIALVASRFNDRIVKTLVEGAIDTLIRHGVPAENVSVTWVPGAFELPVAAKRWARSGQVDGVICLGTVIRGATTHFDYVCGPTASGIAQVSLETEIPTIFGVLTTETIEQAIERAGTKAGNKGAEAAQGVLEMVSLLKQLPTPTFSSN